MALLLVLTLIACVDNGNGEESPSGTDQPAASPAEPTGEEDPLDESSTPADNESEEPGASDTEPAASEKEPETPEATPAPTQPETTKNNSGVIELPRDTF